MVPSQTFPMAAFPGDPVCWAVHSVSSALQLAGGTSQLILIAPPCWVDEKQGKPSALGCQCLAILPPAGLGLSKKPRAPPILKLALGMALGL